MLPQKMKKIVFFGGGSVGVSYDEYDKLRIKNLGGKSPDVDLLIPILDSAFPDWKEVSEKLHRSRINPWKVSWHKGMSGAMNFILKYMEDPEFGFYRTGSVIHVSMYDKLNWGVIFSGWLGDLPPIIAEMINFYPQMVPEKKISLTISDGDFEGWKKPGETSGLKENMEKISQAREIMSNI